MTQRRRGALGRGGAALAAVAALTLVVVPAAEARKAHSVRAVVVHLRAADRATARLAAQPTGPLAAMYLAREQSQTALAAAVAHAMVDAAHGGQASSERAATALGLFADHQTSVTQTLTSLLGEVSPGLQAAVAQAISAATGGRGVALGTLNALLPALSTGAKPVVAQVVALESSQGAQIPVALAGALGANSLSCSATGAVQQALVVSTQVFQIGLSNIGLALSLVPPAVRAQVQSEIDGVPALLHDIENQLSTVLPCPGSTTPAPAGAPVAALKAPALLGGMTQLIDGILGAVLPGLHAGQTPAPIATPAPLAGLLGPLAGLFGGLLGR
ncbi:MAG: hypothetical protein ACR2KV_03675 [Solirubrobacteraceae bacterium]